MVSMREKKEQNLRSAHLLAAQPALFQLLEKLQVQKVVAVLGVAVEGLGGWPCQRLEHARQAARTHLQQSCTSRD